MDEELDKLAFQFFKLFACFESILKERNYFRIERERQITVDWDRFSNEIVGKTYLADLGDKVESAHYILAMPPKRQGVNDDGKIVWIEVSSGDDSPQSLFGHICRMRNNLYHGAKFNGTWFDPERNRELLRHGLTILRHYESWLK